MITVKLPDGSIVQFPDGTAPDVMKKALERFKTPANPMADRIAAAKAGTLQMQPGSAERAAEMDRAAEDQIILSRTPGALNALTKFNQGIPFIGEYTDEAAGKLAGLIDGPEADARTSRAVRETQDAMGRAYPKTSGALQIGGGLVGGAVMARAAGPAVLAAAPASLAGRVVAGAVAGAGAGAIEGGVSGYGAGVGDSRMRAAGDRAALGAAFGGLVGGVAPVVGAGVKNALEWMKGRDTGVIANVLGVSKGAAKVIKASVEADDFNAAAKALKRSGGDAMLADAGPAFSQLLDTSIQTSGSAARIGRDAVEGRAAAAGKKLEATFDAVLGKAAGVRNASRGISARTSGARQSAYDTAYGSPIDYASPQGRTIEGVFGRIPDKTLGAAISEANDAMKAAGVKNLQIMAKIADDGSVTFTKMPNVQQLDEIKKALGTIAQNETDAVTGKITGAGLRAKKLASDLRDAITAAVPSYEKAVKLGGDKIAEDAALDAGRKLLSPATTRETVRDMFANPSIAATDAARRGLREHIDETLSNVRAVVSDTNIDAREALKAVKDMSSKAAREKVEIVLGRPKANRLFSALDEASAHLELRAAVARNSATASRQAGQAMAKEVTAPGPIGMLAEASPVKAGRRIVQLFTGTTPERKSVEAQAIFAEIARALTAKRGPEAAAALRLVENAIEGQPISTQEATAIARAFTTAGALSAYQSGTRLLPTPQGGMR